jgi:hypothetical protein
LFTAKNDRGEQMSLTVDITVPPIPVISIELNQTDWKLDGVKLGGMRDNVDESGAVIHKVTNTGNVPVRIDIGYGPQPDGLIHPGLEQGLDTFTTAIGGSIIPPNERVSLNGYIYPGKEPPLPLTYGAPTALSEPTEGMSATYEIRAYAYAAINQ